MKQKVRFSYCSTSDAEHKCTGYVHQWVMKDNKPYAVVETIMGTFEIVPMNQVEVPNTERVY